MRLRRLKVARTGPILELGWWTLSRGYLIWPIRPCLSWPYWQYRGKSA